jgi:hypothetical protein
MLNVNGQMVSNKTKVCKQTVSTLETGQCNYRKIKLSQDNQSATRTLVLSWRITKQFKDGRVKVELMSCYLLTTLAYVT